MTNIKALEKLRELCADVKSMDFASVGCDAVLEIADEIEAEVSERFVELPCDADGVPWHMGDEVRRTYRKDLPSIVTGIYLYADGIHKLHVSETACTAWTPYASKYRHVKPRTIEAVLEEFLIEFDDWDWNTGGNDRDNARKQLFAKYADEIRGMMA